MRIVTRGFTLVELLITVAIAAVMLGIALPAMEQMIRDQQIVATHNKLVAALLLARSESVKRQKPVVLQNADNLWSNGWILFADENGNGEHDQGEQLLITSGPVPKGIRVSGNTPLRQYVRYVPTGRTRMMSGAFQAGTITLCHEDGLQPLRQLIISATGRMRTTKGGAGSC